jgi:hypothetical protein
MLRSPTVVQHPLGHRLLAVHAAAHRTPPSPQSMHDAVAGQSSVPHRIIPLGAPVTHETSTQTPDPGMSARLTQARFSPATGAHVFPEAHGDAQRHSPAARHTDCCPVGHMPSDVPETQADTDRIAETQSIKSHRKNFTSETIVRVIGLRCKLSNTPSQET